MEAKDPKRSGARLIVGPCRLSYCHLLEKHAAIEGAVPKYSTTVLIPKSETATIEAIKAAIEAAKREGVENKWNHKMPSKLEIAFYDGDEKENAGPEFAGCMYFNAKSASKPGVVDKKGNPIDDDDQVYSGMWARVSVTAFPYTGVGNKGVAFGLNNVMKVADDTRFGGRPSADSDFSGEYDEDDDL